MVSTSPLMSKLDVFSHSKESYIPSLSSSKSLKSPTKSESKSFSIIILNGSDIFSPPQINEGVETITLNNLSL